MQKPQELLSSLYKATSSHQLKAESANMTVLIAALNMQRETSAGTRTVCLMIWLNKLGQRTCPFRTSASSPRNQLSVRSPASWQEIDTRWARQCPDKWGWRLSANIWPPLPNSWIKHWLGIKLKAVHKKTTTFPHLFPFNEFMRFSKEYKSKGDRIATEWCYQRTRTMW